MFIEIRDFVVRMEDVHSIVDGGRIFVGVGLISTRAYLW